MFLEHQRYNTGIAYSCGVRPTESVQFYPSLDLSEHGVVTRAGSQTLEQAIKESLASETTKRLR